MNVSDHDDPFAANNLNDIVYQIWGSTTIHQIYCEAQGKGMAKGRLRKSLKGYL